jgi:hypothetical protein
MESKEGGNEVPRCDHCGIAAHYRTSVYDRQLGRYARVYQCSNCARVIWETERDEASAGARLQKRASR